MTAAPNVPTHHVRPHRWCHQIAFGFFLFFPIPIHCTDALALDSMRGGLGIPHLTPHKPTLLHFKEIPFHISWDVFSGQTTDPSSLRLSALSYIPKQLSRFYPVVLAACLRISPTKCLERAHPLLRQSLRILKTAPCKVKGTEGCWERKVWTSN